MLRWITRSLFRHRDLLWQFVTTDLRGRYAGSSLGLFWTVIHPFVMIVIYTVVFTRVMSAKLAGSHDPYGYSLYLCSALLPWIAFQEVVIRATTLFPDNANLVRKVAFPKVILYGFVATSSAINLGIAMTVFAAVMALAGHFSPLALPLWMLFALLQLAFGLGLGMIASVLHVFLRDTAQLVSVLFQVLFWTTPIVYVEDILPGWLRRLEAVNPLYVFANTHRCIVLDGGVPGLLRTASLIVMVVTTLAIGTALYRHFRSDILDEL